MSTVVALRFSAYGGVVTALSLALPQVLEQPSLLGPELVDRPRLVERLCHSEARLTLLSAPAAAGKTTLLRQWATVETRPLAWLALTEADADADMLRRRIEEALDAAPELLVLDDGSPSPFAWDRTLAAVVETFASDVRVVVSCRTDPPLHVALARARGELEELRLADLRFDADEAAELVRRVARLELAPDRAAHLVERTEGWAAGIYLAALAASRAHDPHGLVDGFSGRNRYVADFLHEAVLAPLPAPLRAFLHRTSVLDELTGPRCDALLERRGSTALLRALARSLQLVLPVAADGTTYRYHGLLRDVLRQDLEREEPALADGLRRRAGQSEEPVGTGPAAEGLALLLGGRAAAARSVLLRLDLAGAAAAPVEAVQAAAVRSLACERLGLYGEAASFARSSLGLAARYGVDAPAPAGLARVAAAASRGHTAPQVHETEPRPRRPHAAELSTAELRVARLLATRLTQREIARELYLSLNTVKTHARSIYRKLGAATREEAVGAARTFNLL